MTARQRVSRLSIPAPAPNHTHIEHFTAPSDSAWLYTVQHSKSTPKTSFQQALTTLIPPIEWLPKYKLKTDLIGDVISGVTVAIFAIPQSCAYALLAGLDIEYGLYSIIVPPVIYSLFGTSRQLSVGIVAINSLVIVSSLSSFAEPFTDKYTNFVLITTLITGIFSLLFGALRLGPNLVSVINPCVIFGYMTASAFIISATTIEGFFGISAVKNELSILYLISIAKNLPNAKWLASVNGLVTSVILLLIRRYAPKIPGPLVVTIHNFTSYGPLLPIVGYIPKGVPSFRIPSISLAEVPSLISPALLLCIIGYLQSISVAQKYATNHIVSPSQEFIALGFSKVIGSFFQSLDTTGSLSRTAVNCDTGARTQLSGMFAAVIVTIVVQFLTFLLYYLPRSSLSAIVLVASFSIYNLPYYPKLYKASPREFVICLITLIVTVFTTTVYGIGSGILLSVLEFLFTLAKPHWAVLGEIIVSASPSPDGRGTSEESERIYRDITRYKNGLEFPNMLIFRFDANMVFLNSSYWRSVIIELLTEREPQCIKEVVVNTTPRKPLFKFSSRNSRTVRPDEHIPDESNSIEITDSPTVKYKGFLILDFSSIDLIDVTACNVLVETISFILKRFKYKVIFSNVKGVVRDSMWRIIGVDLVDELPIDDTHDHLHESVFFVSLKFAVNHAKMVLDNERGGRATASQIGREYFVDEIWQQ